MFEIPNEDRHWENLREELEEDYWYEEEEEDIISILEDLEDPFEAF